MKQILRSMVDNGWSNWFALSFEAKLLQNTIDNPDESQSLALDEIYFMEDCNLLTSETSETSTTPLTTTNPPPNVNQILVVYCNLLLYLF